MIEVATPGVWQGTRCNACANRTATLTLRVGPESCTNSIFLCDDCAADITRKLTAP